MQDPPLLIAPAAKVPCRYMLLRRRLAQLLRQLGVEATDGPDAVIGALARRLGCEIEIDRNHLFAVPGYFGATAITPRGYLILVQVNTSPEHQAHIVMHESAHIMLGTTNEAAESLFRGTHRTGSYDNPLERDAEFVARTISTWMGAARDARLTAQTDERAARLARSLEDRIAWS
ncbi:hypothetical protein [Nocardia alni]|uniref:hypothetical protein n=1 Tax=Nocardia alni TaxID=2815723 RepID=UPI001C23A5BB|nr:hypothetical protein [Nocardia alni]